MSTQISMLPRVCEAIAAITGHQPGDLEAELFLESDLGIDSIKMVELSQRLVLLVPHEQQARFSAEVPTERIMQVQTVGDLQDLFSPWEGSVASPAPAAPVASVAPTPAASAPAVAGEGLSERIFALISSVTGHRPEDLELEQFLEGDLGIDSIKMVELSQKLTVLVPVDQQEHFLREVPTERLMQVQTLGEIVALFAPWQGATTAIATALPVSVPAAAPAAIAAAQTQELELLPSQYPFLVSHWAVSTCSLCSRVRLQGPFDAAVARRAWGDLLARHPALRARFVVPPQATSFKAYRYEVAARVEAPELDITDLSHLNRTQDQDNALTAEVERCVNYQWTLQEPLLHRFFAYRLAEDLVEVFFTNHHLISDGLSNQQVMREFLALYAAQASGRIADLPPGTSLEQYQQVVAGINAWHEPKEDQALAEFLRAQGKQAFVWNPGGASRATSRAHVRNHRFRLDAASTQALLKLTRELRLPMNALLVGAYLRTVASFGGDAPSIFVNIPTSGRVYPGIDASGLIGCFAQNLALDFAAPQAGEDWSALLARVQQRIEHGIAQGYDRAQTRQVAQFARDRITLENGRIPEAHTGMFRAGMKSNLFLPYIGNTHIADSYGPLRVLDYQAATVTNAGTLDTVIEQFHGQLEMTTNYDANHYDLDFVTRVADAFLTQLRALAAYRVAPAQVLATAPRMTPAAPASLQTEQVRQVAEEIMHRPLSAADLGKDLEADLGLDSLERIRIVSRLERFLPGVDRQALLACRSLDEMVALVGGGNPAAASNDDDAMPYRQIIAQCARTPHAVAVLQDGVGLTYGELHRQSNQLAHLLRAQGVARGSLVGVMLPRGIQMQIALLAILKAGGGYVPLDPDYPSARLAYMLEHARIETLLTENSVAGALAKCLSAQLPLRNLVHLDDKPLTPSSYQVFGRADWQSQPTADLSQVSTPDDPMVVLYTSGSTGKPKGVVLGHRGYANRHDWHQQLFQLQPGERVAQKTSICFDISVWELFWPLQIGGTVCPVSTATLRDPWALAQWIRDTGIHVMHFVPSLFGEFLNAVEPQMIAFPALRQLVFSGEALPVAYVRCWFARFGLGAKLANLYGPTEASIDVSAWQMTEMPSVDMARVPIGHAMPNVYLRVLDENMQPAPVGAQGELWIGGMQLAHGYLHDPQRTAESFRANPFTDIPGPMLYRTGDVAVELPDGSFDYRGRADSQVKIRGYRVELGEIETVLGTHPAVREVAVLALDPGDGQLRLSAWLAGEQVEPRVLREFLAQKLPAYMLPQRFEWLPSLPKNQNGKLDRKAIAAQANVAASGASPTSTAVTELEERIVSNDLDYPVGPAQHWLLTYFDAPYQWAGFSRFRYRQPLDIELFNRALGLLVQKHAALRSVFERRGGSWHQHFPQPRVMPQAEVYDGTQVPADLREQQLRAMIVERVQGLRIDGTAPLWAVIVIKEAEDRFDICVVGHHIISDMLGNGVLFKDLWRLYSDCLAGREPVLEEAAPFVSYLESLQKLRSRDALQRYADYWTAQFPASEAAFSVPFDHREGDNSEASSAMEKFALSEADTALLQQARQRYGSSLYNLLLAPLYRALAEWSGRSHVTVSHRVHGRDIGDSRHYFDSVGNFAVNYPLAVQVEPQAEWGTLVQAIRSGFDAVPLNGVSYDLVADHLPGHLYPDDKLTPVRANYLGNRDVPRSELFEFNAADWDQRFALPEQKRSTLIEVFFIAGSGSLQIELSYSSHFHRADTIRRIGERYLALLHDLLAKLPERAPTPALAPAPMLVAVAPVSAPLVSPTPALVGHRPLEGKIAIVTGAGRGIGRDIATTLAGQGAQVALVSRTRSHLDEALEDVRRISPGHLAISADVTRQTDVEAMVAQVAAHFGGIDVLINNAGANRAMLLAESDPREWREIVDINLMATYLCCRSALPHLLERGGGKIVNLSSAAGVIGYPLFSAYSAAKHAIIGLTKALAEEVKQQNVQVNVVCPAFVDTRMTPQAFRNSAMPTSQVADVVTFLASPLSSGITGESINIFGKQDMYSFGSDKLSVFKSMTRDFKPGVAA